MIDINKDQKVKVFLKNGMSPEGTVISWKADEVRLRNDNDDCTLVIYEPKENIVMVKVWADRSKPPNKAERQEYREQVMVEFEDAFDSSPHYKIPDVDPEDMRNALIDFKSKHLENIDGLSKLRQAKINSERDQLAKKLKDFVPKITTAPNYVAPYSNK